MGTVLGFWNVGNRGAGKRREHRSQEVPGCVQGSALHLISISHRDVPAFLRSPVGNGGDGNKVAALRPLLSSY